MTEPAAGQGAIPADEARALVDARRTELRARLDATDARLAGIRSARGEWTDEEHDPEGFALTHEWSAAEGSRAEHRAELAELEAAEQRIDAGEYGICTVCGAPIPVEQLRRRPARRAHVACATVRRR